MDKNLIALGTFAEEVKKVYSAIEEKIEELVLFLNESHGEEESLIKERAELSKHLEGFLGALREQVVKEGRFVEEVKWPREKKARFLGLIKEISSKIKELGASIELAGKGSNTKIIKTIDRLYKQIEVELEEEEEMLEEAA